MTGGSAPGVRFGAQRELMPSIMETLAMAFAAPFGSAASVERGSGPVNA